LPIVAILPDKRVIARTAFTGVVLGAAGNAALAATVTDLKVVEYVLQYNITTSPLARIDAPNNQKIVGNAVGVTVYAGGATTVGGEVISVGF